MVPLLAEACRNGPYLVLLLTVECALDACLAPESGRKKRVYADWLSNWSIQFGVDITERIGEPWSGGAKEERHWVQQALNILVSVRNTGLIAVVSSPNKEKWLSNEDHGFSSWRGSKIFGKQNA